MSINRLHPIAVVMLAGLVSLTGCYRRPKPQPVVPAPMLPLSAMIPVPEALPPDEEEPEPTQPALPSVVATKPKPKPTRNGRRISDIPKPQPATTATNQPAPPENAPPAPAPRITAPSRDVPIMAGGSEGFPHSDDAHHRQTAAQLNQSTEANLRSITRSLTPAEKGIVEQIRSFMSQSQDAITDNDLVRAHNLALKAHLLSDELAHR